MDRMTLIGLAMGFLAIVGGHIIEGGHMSQIMQFGAFAIVIGGTAASTLMNFTTEELHHTIKAIPDAFKFEWPDTNLLIEKIVDLSSKARREGLLAIEREAEELDDAFMRRAMEMVADGTKVEDLKPTLTREVEHFDEEYGVASEVLEAAGGFAPTIGIMGAVLGLIHVMGNLSDPSKLGAGIAVAFVATLYGLGVANLFLLPICGKLRGRKRARTVAMELIVHGACAIASGESPLLTRRKLAIYAKERKGGADAAAAAGKAKDAEGGQGGEPTLTTA